MRELLARVWCESLCAWLTAVATGVVAAAAVLALWRR